MRMGDGVRGKVVFLDAHDALNGVKPLEESPVCRPANQRAAADDPGAATLCEIRTLDTVEDLIESYRLRYEVYEALGYVQRLNKSKLEIDEYDSLSVPFGAFDSMSGRMIGTLRLITNETQPGYERLMRRAVAELADDELAGQVSGSRPFLLPSIISQDVNRQIVAFNTERFALQELSRTIVRPSHRGSGISRGLMEFGLAHAARFTPAVLVGGCLTEHLPMYARYGYERLPQTSLAHFYGVGQIANVVVCRTDMLPYPTRSHVDELLRCMRSGATECMLEIGRGSCALYRLAAPRRARRRGGYFTSPPDSRP